MRATGLSNQTSNISTMISKGVIRCRPEHFFQGSHSILSKIVDQDQSWIKHRIRLSTSKISGFSWESAPEILNEEPDQRPDPFRNTSMIRILTKKDKIYPYPWQNLTLSGLEGTGTLWCLRPSRSQIPVQFWSKSKFWPRSLTRRKGNASMWYRLLLWIPIKKGNWSGNRIYLDPNHFRK